MIIAGIDEAGYGPLLGPLVVSATAFELADQPLPDDIKKVPCLWKLLKAAVAKKAPAKKGRLLVADSKIVRAQNDGNKLLERGVLTFLRSYTPTLQALYPALTAPTLIEHLACTNHELTTHPWYTAAELPLPWLAEAGDLAISSNMLTAAMDSAKLKTVCMRTAVVSESRYNRMIGDTNNKASTLVSITLSHLYHLHTNFAHQGLVVGIDKQGGRDHYTTLLLQYFPDAHLKVLLESDIASTYLLTEPANATTPERRSLICFREKGESAFLPTALASMVCKYLRELCMHSFNNWWCQQIAGLRPTAGYYNDGSRWLTDVEPHLERLGIQRHTFVRSR